VSNPYDSRPDTHEHIAQVRGLVLGVAADLTERAHRHDRSKLAPPEVEVFDRVTPLLKDSTYGSDEYKGFLADMGEGLAHHYAENDHHPEHFDCGIKEMDLIQLTEMLCDWIAATRRHTDWGHSPQYRSERRALWLRGRTAAAPARHGRRDPRP
jgi:hypothetical protein